MKQFPMLAKETKELSKSFKMLIMPLIFTLLALMQPITLKMLPNLLKNAEDFPEGTVIQIPEPLVSDVLSGLLSSVAQMGVIIIILMVMGTIAGERSLDITAMVLVKPIGRAKYYFAKIFTYSVLVIVSTYIALSVSVYYTEIIFGKVSWSHILLGTTVYIPNLLLVIAVTIFFSSFLKSQMAVAGAAFISYIILNKVPQYLGGFINSFSPNELGARASEILVGANNVEILKPLLGVVGLSIILILCGWFIFRKQEI
ncbi:ABC transporter permease [Oceanirhabdus sp. W0125-5]|uniref:ABC transporter permease n=1 Tax=Oceanirhabdus sp. W0125-5 TaxID=2999116 RepID=UPI0022F32C15|nr:ABC transporter permease subunit [Oceanirhabdus sp. W0125-5]WBW98338.1 hypothetical protein OW730_06105 [Oceanirhabdus sp. W0125-5]